MGDVLLAIAMVLASTSITVVGMYYGVWRRLGNRPIEAPKDSRSWPAEMSIQDIVLEAELDGKEQWDSDQRWNRMEQRTRGALP
jgi:hypothetical protein